MKVTASTQPKHTTITMQTTEKKGLSKQSYKWWTAKKDDLCDQLLTTANFLKETQGSRYRQAAIFSRLYGNQSLFNFLGSSMNKVGDLSGLPTDRPTFNLIQSCVDTQVSRISQSRPAPVFLTDNSDYKERNLAKKLNSFILGEFYQTNTYTKATTILRDALVEGTGCLKVFETPDKRVGLDRVLLTELMIDLNESMYGDPRQLYQIKLIDREVLASAFTKHPNRVKQAEGGFPDNSADSTKTVSDLVLVVEAWRLPSGKDTEDGRHAIVCSSGTLLDEEYDKDKFPFVFLHYSPRLLGFWAQGLAEQLMGTQLEINALLFTITRAIKLVGVPRVFVESGSKITKSHFNNDIGTMITFTGTKPIYEVAQCVPQELYAQLQRLIDYGYQQCGVSTMQASSVKPAGLNSGEAIRSYDDISSDRMAFLSRSYDNVFVDLAYLIIDKAKEIAEREGSYQTVYPNKNCAKEIDLPKADLLQDPFVIQCFNMSSLPRDPAGRMAKVTEMIQAGMITIKEGRRLLDYPDLGQVETLANASEERIFQILDEIVEGGDDFEYTQPDPFMDLVLAKELVVQYYNLYAASKLEEEKQDLLRTFYNQVCQMITASQAPTPNALGLPMGPGSTDAPPQALPEATPTSPMIPNGANVLGVQ